MGKARYDRRAEEKIWGRRYCRNLTNRASGANHSGYNAKQHNHNAIRCKHRPSCVSCSLFDSENTSASILTWSKTLFEVKSPAICPWLRHRVVSLAYPMKPNRHSNSETLFSIHLWRPIPDPGLYYQVRKLPKPEMQHKNSCSVIRHITMLFLLMWRCAIDRRPVKDRATPN